jgi:hypothetical protein
MEETQRLHAKAEQWRRGAVMWCTLAEQAPDLVTMQLLGFLASEAEADAAALESGRTRIECQISGTDSNVRAEGLSGGSIGRSTFLAPKSPAI